MRIITRRCGGVLRAALWALTDYMGGHGYGKVTFSVWDGANQVREGLVDVAL